MMGTRTGERDAPPSLAEMIDQLGGIPLERIWTVPAPGSATEEDLLEAKKHTRGKLLELVDGVLVEKSVGTREALLGGVIVQWLWNHVEEHDLGQVLPGDGMLRLEPGLVRVPDVSFLSWKQMPQGKLPDTPIANLYPDLAIEILSEGNTPAEIERKSREFFFAGTQLVWVINPRSQTAEVFTAPDESVKVGKGGSLDASPVVPGYVLSLKQLFGRTQRRKKSKS